MYDDDYELDEDDLESLIDDDASSINPEDLLNVTLLNEKEKKRIYIELEDSEGDQVDLADMIQELVNYMKDQLNAEDDNQLLSQILPLMTQTSTSALSRLYGVDFAGFLLTNPNIQQAIIYTMVISFILYKVVQSKGLLINTVEEEVSDDEIEEIRRQSKASTMLNMTSALGIDPREALQALVEQGQLTQEDVDKLFYQLKNNDD